MTKIFKYKIDQNGEAVMPRNAEILSVANQDNDICIWAIVGPENKHVTRKFKVVATGEDYLNNGAGKFIGTVHGIQGWLVFHVFDFGELT